MAVRKGSLVAIRGAINTNSLLMRSHRDSNWRFPSLSVKVCPSLLLLFRSVRVRHAWLKQNKQDTPHLPGLKEEIHQAPLETSLYL